VSARHVPAAASTAIHHKCSGRAKLSPGEL
jgi:hypothetical protein